MVTALLTPSRQGLVLFTASEAHARIARPTTRVLANALGTEFLERVDRQSRAPELALFEAGSRCAQINVQMARGHGDTPSVADELDELAAEAMARVRPSGDFDSTSCLCRIVMPVLVVAGKVMESWQTSSAEIKMLEQDEIPVKLQAEHGTGPVLIHVARERSILAFAARFRGAFDVLRRQRALLQNAVAAA
jgi:hypothetical protein